MNYKQMYENDLIERQVLEEDNKVLDAEQEENKQNMKSLWINHYDNFALAIEIERLQGQLIVKFRSILKIKTQIDELKNWLVRYYMYLP